MTPGDPSNADPRRLALLLGLPADHRDWEEDELAALLQLQLSTPIPADPARSETLRGCTFREVLSDPHPALAALEQIKNSAKATRAAPNSPLPEPVVSLIYFASISAAMVRCSKRISSLESGILQEGIRWSLGRRWLDPDLRRVLEEADALLIQEAAVEQRKPLKKGSRHEG